jgi:hypothetical protein
MESIPIVVIDKVTKSRGIDNREMQTNTALLDVYEKEDPINVRRQKTEDLNYQRLCSRWQLSWASPHGEAVALSVDRGSY